MADPNAQQSDKLSGEDLAALTETYRHLRDTQDPRADKVGAFIRATVQSGNFGMVDPKNPDHAGFFSSIGSDLWDMAKSAPAALAEPFRKASIGPLGRGQEFVAEQQQMANTAQQRKAEGYGPLYRTAAPIGENILGVNAKGMEQSAKEGDVGGVLGHAAAVPTAMAVGEGVRFGGPPAIAAVKNAIPQVLDPMAARSITKLIKPTVADLKFGRNPAQAIIKEGITANSLEDLGPQVYQRAREVGKQIDQVLQTPAAQAKTIDVNQALKPIDEGMKKAVASGDKPVYDRLQELKQQLTQTWAEDSQSGSIKPTGPRKLTLNPMEATEFKRQVGDMTRWTGTDPFENQINAVKGDIFSNVKNLVNGAVPEVSQLNSRYADLVSAGKAIERRIPVVARNAEFSLSDIASTGFALHAGGPVAGGVLLGRKLGASTAFKTRMAQAISSQADIYPKKP